MLGKVFSLSYADFGDPLGFATGRARLLLGLLGLHWGI
jgi:hypothetical protein